ERLLPVGRRQPASAQTSPRDLAKQAVEAVGGANALRAITTLITKADSRHWEPGQSHSINGESRFLGDSALTITVDYSTNPAKVRYDWDRDMKYPAVARIKYRQIRDRR